MDKYMHPIKEIVVVASQKHDSSFVASLAPARCARTPKRLRVLLAALTVAEGLVVRRHTSGLALGRILVQRVKKVLLAIGRRRLGLGLLHLDGSKLGRRCREVELLFQTRIKLCATAVDVAAAATAATTATTTTTGATAIGAIAVRAIAASVGVSVAAPIATSAAADIVATARVGTAVATSVLSTTSSTAAAAATAAATAAAATLRAPACVAAALLLRLRHTLMLLWLLLLLLTRLLCLLAVATARSICERARALVLFLLLLGNLPRRLLSCRLWLRLLWCLRRFRRLRVSRLGASHRRGSVVHSWLLLH